MYICIYIYIYQLYGPGALRPSWRGWTPGCGATRSRGNVAVVVEVEVVVVVAVVVVVVVAVAVVVVVVVIEAEGLAECGRKLTIGSRNCIPATALVL